MNNDPPQPVFGCIKEIWLIHNFVYFEVFLFDTICFCPTYQEYLVEESSECEHVICPYEQLVDYNVCHKKMDHEGRTYIPVKYNLDDIVEEHFKNCNPLHE